MASPLNYRDAGEWANVIAGRVVVPAGRVLRCGRLDLVADPGEIGYPGTIVNLRRGPDPADRRFGAEHLHAPAANDVENYETVKPAVRQWLTGLFAALAEPGLQPPVLFHCTSGKDRTGVVVAALLTVLGVDRAVVVDEYLLSDGDVRRELIEAALDGVGDPADYFGRATVRGVRAAFGLA